MLTKDKMVAYLSPYFQYLLESHTRIRQFTLQKSYDILVMLVYLFPIFRLCSLSFPLFNISLESRNLFIYAGKVLLYYKREFL